MTLFNHFETEIQQIFENLAVAHHWPEGLNLARVTVELPRDEAHGDLATNAAMVMAGQVKMKPRDLADLLADQLRQLDKVEQVDIAGPGFINITLTHGYWGTEIGSILEAGADYGRSDLGGGAPVNVEFVSANPTGPLHAAHARGAIFGDVLAHLLSFTGYDVTREYYINDAGAQVDVLGRSALLRYREALGEEIGEIPAGLYPGAYLKEVGEALKQAHGSSLLEMEDAARHELIRNFAIEAMMASIKADLAELGVAMDIYSSERAFVESGRVQSAMDRLASDGLVYTGIPEAPKGAKDNDWEPREQLLFKSSDYGDDVDRALQKSDGSWTYFASDVAYHMDKLDRTKGQLIDVWGADHGGYVKRMSAAIEAMSGQKNQLDVKLCQLVSLLDNGKPVKMSKRAGTFVTLSDVMAAVGADVMRFIMLTRRSDQPLEFDYAKVTEKSRDNPVFYVQYGHARACSVLRQPEAAGLNLDRADADRRLTAPAELRLIKQLCSWPKALSAAALAHEPHRIAFYLMDLAADFHALWNAGRDDPALKFIQAEDEDITTARLRLVKATAQVLKSGLGLMSITAYEEM